MGKNSMFCIVKVEGVRTSTLPMDPLMHSQDLLCPAATLQNTSRMVSAHIFKNTIMNLI